MNQIIGRESEITQLNKLFHSKDAEFLAIYGRRRVGKTFLIRQFFLHKECVFFNITGQKNATAKEQLTEFTKRVEEKFYVKGVKLMVPKNWREAFALLTDTLKERTKDQKMILFFDELPWLATKKSKLIQALDYYWNQYWSEMTNVKLIVCGSAASWMIDKIINDKGGLHNRVTQTMLLDPFTLLETKKYLHDNGVRYLNKQILEVYLATGGIPYYLKNLDKSLSVPQNIDHLCFNTKGLLYKEFKELFSSLFEQASIYEEIIRIIAQSRKGITREEIAKKARLSTTGGRLSKRLEALETAGFIISFVPFGYARKNHVYRVIDEYTLFYLKWIEPVKAKLRHHDWSQGYWSQKVHSAEWKSWCGYAFEGLCYKHLPIIRKKLNISPSALADSWQSFSRKGTGEAGAQIDLLFDRDDEVITVCEIKYRLPEYIFNKEEAKKLQRKVAIFKAVTKTKKQIQLALITVIPLKPTMYSEELIVGNVTMNDFMDEKFYV